MKKDAKNLVPTILPRQELTQGPVLVRPSRLDGKSKASVINLSADGITSR